MTATEFIEAREELDRLKAEGKFIDLTIDYVPTEREEELDLLDRKCDAWVKGKLEDKDVGR